MNFLPTNTKIDFTGKRSIFFILSGLMILATFFIVFTKGLHYGIDFKGGFVINIRTSKVVSMDKIRSNLGALKIGDPVIQQSSDKDVMIKLQKQDGDDKSQAAALDRIKKSLESLDKNIEYRSVDTVGPKASNDLIKNGIQAVIWSLIAMLIYIGIQFDWKFGVCSIIAIVHDCISIVAMYAFFQIEMNTSAIMAILVTAGYSINDTVVVFDRVRENLGKFKKISISEIVNLSVNETLSRTILTSGTTLIALFSLYFFGGAVIADYSLPIIVGVTVGTYSSICIAGTFLTFFDIRLKTKKTKEITDYDII
jgi:preprotein translocase subunit SecF